MRILGAILVGLVVLLVVSMAADYVIRVLKGRARRKARYRVVTETSGTHVNYGFATEARCLWWRELGEFQYVKSVALDDPDFSIKSFDAELTVNERVEALNTLKERA